MPRNPVELFVLPLPGEDGKVRPREALRWLRVECSGLVFVVRHLAAQASAPETRTAAETLSIDVEVLIDECARAVESGKGIRVARAFENNPGDPGDFDGYTLDLARVVGSSHVFDDYSWSSHSVALESLGQELVRRLEASQARERGERSCPVA